MTVMTFQGHGFKGQGHRQHFPKCTFPAEAYRSTVHRIRRSMLAGWPSASVLSYRLCNLKRGRVEPRFFRIDSRRERNVPYADSCLLGQATMRSTRALYAYLIRGASASARSWQFRFQALFTRTRSRVRNDRTVDIRQLFRVHRCAAAADWIQRVCMLSAGLQERATAIINAP